MEKGQEPTQEQEAQTETQQKTGQNLQSREEMLAALSAAREESAKRRISERQAQDQIAALSKQLEDLQTAQQEQKEKELADQQQWQQLAEKRAATIAEMEAKLQRQALDFMRVRIAGEYGLSGVKLDDEAGVTLADYLRGDTEEEIRKDAERLSKVITPPDASKPEETPEQKPEPEQSQAGSPKTSAAPGGTPVGRTDADRHRDYYQGTKESPLFQGGGFRLNTKSD